jgi:hypothetical protein
MLKMLFLTRNYTVVALLFYPLSSNIHYTILYELSGAEINFYLFIYYFNIITGKKHFVHNLPLICSGPLWLAEHDVFVL